MELIVICDVVGRNETVHIGGEIVWEIQRVDFGEQEFELGGLARADGVVAFALT